MWLCLKDLRLVRIFLACAGQSESSELINLPTSGTYTLVARSNNGTAGAYAFQLNQTNQTLLGLNETYSGSATGSGYAQLFRLEIPERHPLQFQFDGQSNTNRFEVYVRRSLPPTRQVFDAKNSVPGADHVFYVPSVVPGTWYVLVYGEKAINPGGGLIFQPKRKWRALAEPAPNRRAGLRL